MISKENYQVVLVVCHRGDVHNFILLGKNIQKLKRMKNSIIAVYWNNDIKIIFLF